MDEYYGYDLHSDRGRYHLASNIIELGVAEMKEEMEILRGHPCADEFFEEFPHMAKYF